MAKKHQVGVEIKTTADPRGARQAEAAIEKVEDSTKKLRDELAKVKGLPPEFKKQVQGVTASMDKAAASSRKLATAQGQGKKANSKAALGFLEVSRAVEDAQYGLRGVLNNLPGIIQNFGGGAGLAGAVSIAAVSFTQLMPLLFDFGERSKESAALAEELATKMEAIDVAGRRGGAQLLTQQVELLSDALEIQNQELRLNRDLLIQKRQQELQLAALQDDADMASVAARALSDPNFTPDQQSAAIEAIRLRKIEREKQQAIIEAQQKIEDVLAERASLQQEMFIAEMAMKETAQAMALKQQKEARLLTARAQAKAALGDADKNREKATFNMLGFIPLPRPKFENAALEQEAFAEKRFGSRGTSQLKDVQRELLEFSRLNSEQQQRFNEISQKLNENSNLLQAAKLSEESTVAHAEKVAEIKTLIDTTQSATKEAEKNAQELKAGVEEVLSNSNELEGLTSFEAERVRQAKTTLENVLRDGVVRADEFAPTQDAATRLLQTSAAQNEKLANALSMVLEKVRAQDRKINALEENARRISNNSGG